MNILIVSATKFEIEHLLNKMNEQFFLGRNIFSCKYKKHKIDFLVTGVGMVATAFHSSRTISGEYDSALNIGICGSFNKNLEIGTVVNIYEDCFSELGAEDGDEFLSLEDLNLDGIAMITNTKHQLSNKKLNELPKVNGITVNTTHGNEKTIDKVFKRFHPIVESMEGAAFMFASENEGIPYAQIRAVSNYVERRNKDNWNIPLAIENLNKKVLEILDAF